MTRLAFGSVDFCLETGIQGGEQLDFVRAQLTVESCLAGLAAPIEGVTIDASNRRMSCRRTSSAPANSVSAASSAFILRK